MKVTSTLSSTRFGDKLNTPSAPALAQARITGTPVRLLAERLVCLLRLLIPGGVPSAGIAPAPLCYIPSVNDTSCSASYPQLLPADDRMDPPDRSAVDLSLYHVPTTTVPRAMNEPSLLNTTSIHRYRWYSKQPVAGGSRFRSRLFGGHSHRERLPAVFTNGQLKAALRLRSVRAFCVVAVSLLALVGGSVSAQSINLSVRQIAQPKKPALNSPVNYTIIVKNSGLGVAAGITVRDSLPVAGTTFGSLNVLRGSGVTNTTPGDFTDISIPTLAAGDSVVLQLALTARQQGVWFNIVEVTTATGTDVNSVPGNHSLLEDDYDATCFAIPLTWYPGDQFLVSIPSGYSGIQWYRNGTLLTATSDSAVVNIDGTLTIKGPGAYSFSTTRNGCTNGNCCDIEVVAGALARLGNFVFEDLNVNGIQDAGEPGLLNVAVTLYLNGTSIRTTNTDANGLYSFTNLTPGSSNSYVVGFTTPSGYSVTAANVAAGTPGTDSDASLATGRSGSYTVTPGEYNQTIDAGFYAPASIGNYVFADNNRNGIQDGGDTPIASVTVTLYQNGSAVATTTTGADGLYEFANLTPGSSNSYAVGFTTPANFTLTTPLSGTDKALDSDVLVSGKTASLTLASGEQNTTIDAGYTPLTASLGNYVFEDVNVNGIQDAGDKPIQGVTVRLLQGSTLVATTSTDVNGLYNFTGLSVNTPYSVSFSAPTGLTATLANVGDDALDSDAGANGLTTQTYSLSANEYNQTVDAGFYKTGSIGNYVFADNNRNGIQDGGDTPIASVTVTLYQNGSAVATTTTGADGLYEFANLTPGSSNSYVVGFTTPANFTLTTPLSGTDKALDSDVLVSGKTASLTLASGEQNTTIDAGYTPLTASLGNYVFEDVNVNGIQDAGDKPIQGVTVRLLQGSTLVATTTTDINGLYNFSNLPIGVPYSVSFSAPTGLTATLANVGNDALDSDIGLNGLTTQTYSLSANEYNQTVDAGFYKGARLGNCVFADNNRNGIQDGEDTPIASVTVTLYQNGSAVSTTVTGADGIYYFNNLTPGSSNSYVVGFTLPGSFTPTAPLVGNDRSIDSDVLASGKTASLTLASGEESLSIDAGYVPLTASLGNYVFEDVNVNGIQDAGDKPIQGLTVRLLQGSTLVATTSTDVNGLYNFTGLSVNTPYSVSFSAPTGLTATLANVGDDALDSDIGLNGLTTQTYSLSANEYNQTVDGGFYKTGSIGNYVFADNNRNGIQDGGDTPISSVTVTLYQNGNAVATAVTGADGLYEFANLTPGSSNSYVVGFTTPANFTLTTPLSGTDKALDSDVLVSGKTASLTLASGEQNTTIDAGYTPLTASLGNYVFEDVNVNGIQDAGDKPIQGVVVTLLQNSNVVATTSTDLSGLYSFTGLTVNVPYSVSFTTPTGLTATLANVGNDALDSDIGLNGLTTQTYSLSANEYNQTVDAGFYKSGSVITYVFVDTNKDGIQNAGDTPVSSVTVTLYQNGTAVATTTTGIDGIGTFTNLTPGSSNSYVVGYTTPTNFTLTTPLSGTDKALDSDVLVSGLTASFTLVSGQTNSTIDAGFIPLTAGLGNYVFGDLNANGIQDAGDKPILGVIVTLLQGSTVVATTTTNLSGLYSFTGLNVNTPYSVSFTTPTGLTATLANVGDDALDSDGDKLTGLTKTYSLSANEFNQTVDMGYIGLASLGSFVFADNNKDGVQDAGDAPIAGVTVTLYQNGTAVATTVTDPTGKYIFTGLTPGSSNTYVIGFSTPTSYSPTSPLMGADTTKDSNLNPLTGLTQGVVLSSGQSNTTVDAGFVLPSTGDGKIGDYVWYDYNADGRQGPATGVGAEPGVPGVTVQLYNATTNALLKSTITASDGSYLFDFLDTGAYYVKFNVPDGSVLATYKAPGVPADLNSDAGLDGKTGIINIDTTQPLSSSLHTNLTVDAGITPFGSIGDLVFRDTNGDGIQNDGPNTGIAGVKVQLYDVTTGLKLDEVLTNNVGTYQFDSLKAGSYQVKFILPVGETFTGTGQGTSATDSDASITTGLSGTIVIDVKQPVSSLARNNPTIDAGISGKCLTPPVLTVSANARICVGEKATVVASTTIPGSTIEWFLTPLGGDTLFTTRTGQSYALDPTTTTTYYARATTPDGCRSIIKAVVVTVNTKPATPVTAGRVTNSCPKTTVDLTALSITNQPLSGSVFEFHTTALPTSPVVANQTAVTGGKYYLFEKSKDGCYSDPTVVTVEIVDCSCPTLAGVTVTGPAKPVCSGDTIKVSATVQGAATSVTWTADGTGSFGTKNSLNTYYIASAADKTKGSVTFTATTNDPDGSAVACSPATSAVVVTLRARPNAPLGAAADNAVICLGSKVKLVAFAPGYSLYWYDSDNKYVGTASSGLTLELTPTKTGSITYYAETIGQDGLCPSETLTPVTILVQPCIADLSVEKQVVTAGPYKTGQKVTYSLTARNNGSGTANSVTVSEALPAGLTYLSSTPANEFNPATGVWTVGQLTVGASRNLQIETTLTGSGVITNKAIVRSPDNDITKTFNDTSFVTITTTTPDVCNVAPPRVYCAITEICKGEFTTLTARDCDGTIVWSDGQQGGIVNVRPTITTTYSASCVTATCTSGKSKEIVITVLDLKAPILTASSDALCPGGSVTLTVSGCTNGKPVWSEGQQGVTSIVVQPTVKTTYTVQCQVNSCLSPSAEKTIDVGGTSLPKPTVVCSTTVVCPGESVTLEAKNCGGSPLWNTGETTPTILVFPTPGKNVFSVVCKSGSCVSPQSDDYTIKIVTPAVPTVVASADTVCVGGTVTLTAFGCEGSVIWSVNSLTQTANSITITPTANQSYYAQCKFRSCLSDRSAPIAIAIGSPTTPTISVKPAKPLFCAGESVTLTAANCNGTVHWSNNAIGATLTFIAGESASYTAYCAIGSCRSANSNTIQVSVGSTGTAPTITASSLTVCTGASVTLTAANCAGTVQWSDNQTGASITVQPTLLANEYYAVCKPTSGTACGSPKSATTKITLTTPGVPTVTCSTTVICPGESVNLVAGNCIGTPFWSTGATTPTIDVKPAVTTGYTVYCKDLTTGCTSPLSATYTITVTPVVPPTITASATAVTPGQSVTLTASACPGVVSWSNNLTGQSIVITPTATMTIYAQCKFRTCLSDPSATVKIILSDAQSVSCLAKAGTLTTDTPVFTAKKGTTAVLTAKDAGGRNVPTGYTAVYVLTKGSEQVIQQLSSAASFTVSADSTTLYTIHTLVYDANKGDKDYLDLTTVQFGKTTATDVVNSIAAAKVCADLDGTGVQVKIKYLAPPVIVASATEVCYGTAVSFTATGCAGIVKWSNGLTGSVISLTATENLSLRATCTENGVTSDGSNSINVNVIRPSVPTVVSNRLSVCTGETATLTAVGCEKGTVKWSNGATGSSITVTPTASLNTFRAQCVVGTCVSEYSAPVSLTVGNPAAPTVSIAGVDGSNATICAGASVTLTAQGCQTGTSIRWSNDQTGSSITVVPTANATYTAQCYSTTSCISAASKGVSIVVRPTVAQPRTSDLANTCPFITVDLTKGTVGQATTTGGVFEYYTDAALTTAVATPTAAAASGTYYVVEKSGAGCYSLPGTIRVLITPCGPQVACDQNPITVNAGVDASICAAKDYKLAGTTTGTVNSVYWTTSGTGTFNDPFSPTATYTASAKDIETGVVSLTLTAKASNPACPVVSDALSLTITGIKTAPSVGASGPLAFCAGDSVTLRASADAGYTYKWSTKATTPGIVVKTSGTYTVTLFDANGCSSLPSAPVTVTVRDSVPTPVVANIRNLCPETSASLSRLVSGTAAAGTTYEFRTGPVLATSSLYSGTALTGSATVYVFAKSAQGCYSRPAVAKVSIFTCKGDSIRADVSISKIADRTIVKPGTPVKYTIRVTNNGPAIARNIDIRDAIPTGLTAVTGTGFKFSNGIITRRFDSLAVGKSDSITFLASVTVKGAVVNKALITYTDVADPIAKNDTASVTVRDTTTAAPAGRIAIGLAKSLISARQTSDSTFEASYAFMVRNYGSANLSNVKIADNLSRVFATHKIQTVTITTETGSTLKPNPAFTGTGTAIQLLDSTASSLAAGASQSVRLTVSVKLNKADTTRTFANSALVTALNSGTLLQDASVAGLNPDPDNDGNPNNNSGATTFTLSTTATTTPTPATPQLGVALAMVRAVKQPDDSYNVTYKVTVKNFGTVKLTNVSLLDSLGKVFKAPTSYSVIVPPTVAVGSGLVPVSDFNGGTVPYFLYSGGSSLAAGATDSLTFTINVKPNGNFGPFNTSVTGSATPQSSTVVVRDISNNGYDPKPEGSLVTPVLFNLPSALLGVAKAVGTPVLVEAGVYDVPYTIKLTNAGTVALKKVQVVDNLNNTFNRGALIVSSVVAVTADAGLTANPGYSGQGLLTNMLTDTLSTLPVGASRSLRFSVRVNVKNADSLRFYNTAIALATTVDGSLALRDTSTAGTNPDPDGDGDPRNNSTPTVVTLTGPPGAPHLGLALSIRDTVRQANGTYNVTYRLVVKNYGAQNLASVALTDTLAKVFNPLTGANYTLVSVPRTSAGSQLKVNPLFNGNGDARLVLPDSTSKLGVGKVDTVYVTINVTSTGKTGVFLSTVYGSAKAGTEVVTDVSTNGLNPDLNSNGNPSDSNESQPTPLVLNQVTQTTLFIPEGFSPNNDGINDVFVIQGTQGLTVNLEVFNRWGHLVYKSDNYQNDWTGVSNTGLLNGDSQGLPDGTYFYRIRLSDGREFVRYMTINR